jgi:heterodisulfide reductase subunit B2
MRLSYFPGCSAHGTGIEQDRSTRAVCAALGIELGELDDWNCCGSTAAHAIGGDLADSLGARNLEIAAGMEGDLLVPCAACYANLVTAAERLERSNSYNTRASHENLPGILSAPALLAREEVLTRIHKKRRTDLSHLRVAPYYGCLLVRHGGSVQAEKNPENPVLIDRIVEVCGAQVGSWSHKTTCCGGGLSVSSPGLVGDLSLHIVDEALRAGVNAIVTACPMCHLNLESQQWLRQRADHTAERLPVLYVTELVGLALGLPETPSWLKRHLVDPQMVLHGKEVTRG